MDRGQEEEVMSREEIFIEASSEINVTGGQDELEENGEEPEAEGYAHEQELLRIYKNDDRIPDTRKIWKKKEEC